MNCLEFKRLALSDPNSKDVSFIEHSNSCPDCLKYISGVRKMDADLTSSLDVNMPSDLTARLQLNAELIDEAEQVGKRSASQRYAIAASVAIALFVGGFMLSNQIALNEEINSDYQNMLAGVLEHMNEQPITPVWEPARANSTVNALLASYNTDVRFKQLDSLQFGRICPMGQYRGLHASMETEHGQITFAFIKGEALGELLDASYHGYITRVKPVRGGNLVIFSRSQKSLDQADRQLEDAMYWDI
ncbi:MAG: DUF3379 family protein [Pseudomonadota bacterium]